MEGANIRIAPASFYSPVIPWAPAIDPVLPGRPTAASAGSSCWWTTRKRCAGSPDGCSRRTGGRCWKPADGQAALQLIGEREGRLDLVVTDLNMPRVSGRELAEVVSVFHPGLPVLGITGFLSGVSHDRRLPILPKPFSPGSLVQAVRMACGMSIRLQAPRRENRARARRLRELTTAGPGTQVDLVQAVHALRDIAPRDD